MDKTNNIKVALDKSIEKVLEYGLEKIYDVHITPDCVKITGIMNGEILCLGVYQDLCFRIHQDKNIINVIDKSTAADMSEHNKIKEAIAQLEEEKEFAYADFEEYNEEVLGYDDTDVCERDLCYIGIARAIDILKKL